MRKLAVLFGFAAMTMGCNDLQSHMDKYFPDPTVQEFALCLSKTPDDQIGKCKISKDLIDYENTEIEGSPNILEYALYNQKKFGFSPRKLEYLIEQGANPESIAGTMILSVDFEYFKSFVRAVGGPNALNDRDWYRGSILHATVAYWEEEKLDYLVNKLDADLEQRESLNGETAILAARRAQNPKGELSAIRWLIDAGADPNVKDSRGRDLCEFLGRFTPEEIEASREDYEAVKSALAEPC